MVPCVTYDPAITPSFGTRNVARTSAVPRCFSQLLGLQHPGERGLDVVDRVVDHAVQADVDAFLLGELARLLVRAHVEPDHDAVRRERQRDVVLGDAAGRGAHDVHAHLLLRQLQERVGERAERPLDVGLHDEVELGDLGALSLAHQVRQRRRPRDDQLGRAHLRLALGRDVSRLALVVDLAEVVARARHVAPARGSRTGFDSPAWISDRPFSSCIARILANAVPQTSASPADSVPFCTSTVATGPRPLSRWASITAPRAWPVGSPFSSSRSATSRIVSSSDSSPASSSPRRRRTRTCRRTRTARCRARPSACGRAPDRRPPCRPCSPRR